MRYLFIYLFLFSFGNIFSQCTPDTSLLNSSWGLFPDTIQNLPQATITYNYNTVLQLRTPTTVDEVVAQPVNVGGLTLDLTGWPVDSLQLINVTGLPAGMSWNCDNLTCTWLGDDIGCVEISGTPIVGGTYDLIFQIDGFITMGAMGVMSVSGATGGYLDYTGYQIIVDTCLPTTSTTAITTCDSYEWNGTTYTASGSYDYFTTNISGCDSTAMLNLTINNSTINRDTMVTCDSFTWLANGVTYISSTIDTLIGVNAVGCQETSILYLTINHNTTSITNITVCDSSYDWNGMTYITSGSYDYITISSSGCDSTATLNLSLSSFSPAIDIVSSIAPPLGSGCPHVCLGDSIVFEVDTGFVSYGWNTGDTTNRVVVYPQGNITYVVEALDANGCEARDTICVEVWQSSIDILSSISPPLGSNCPHVCLGDSIVLEAHTGFMSYGWNTGQIADTTHRVVVYPQGNITYVVEALDSNGCEARDTICVEVWQSPPLFIASVPDPPVVCIGDTLILEASSGFVSYSWNIGQVCAVCNTIGCMCNPASCTCTPANCSCGAGNAGHIFIDDPIQDTWYIVEAIDSNGCIALEDINVIVDSCNVSSINNNIDNIFNVYPNPSKGKFNIIINNLNDYDKIQVLNSLGNIVYYNNNLESNINLDLSDNEIGVYYLALFGEKKHVVRKIFLLK